MLFTESPDLEGKIGLVGIIEHEVMNIAGKKKTANEVFKVFFSHYQEILKLKKN